MAADFSIDEFRYLIRLILWHGRNSYKRSAKLSQFVIHRGLIIACVQAVFSVFFYFSSVCFSDSFIGYQILAFFCLPKVPIFTGYLMVGYAPIYTMFPVFSLILDSDVPSHVVTLYPELYVELQKGRPLTMKTFLCWVWKRCVLSLCVEWNSNIFSVFY